MKTCEICKKKPKQEKEKENEEFPHYDFDSPIKSYPLDEITINDKRYIAKLCKVTTKQVSKIIRELNKIFYPTFFRRKRFFVPDSVRKEYEKKNGKR